MIDDKMVSLEKLEKESKELCRQTVDALRAILNDSEDSYAKKVKAIIVAGKKIEKLNYISEFSSFRWYPLQGVQPDELDRIQFIMNNELKP